MTNGYGKGEIFEGTKNVIRSYHVHNGYSADAVL